ncbi:MAG TPA: RecQ family ATP-dependent DNA helicase [Firmicutes bacterium]|nr:RecQ family ATP-dependent DNA helicase [Bacillota bacterium]
MSEPRCPVCGSPMVLRTARKGPNAGDKFYGCSRYPGCRGTLPFPVGEGAGNDISPAQNEQVANLQSSGVSIPHRLVARSRYEGCQVRFFESVAVPFPIMEEIPDIELPEANMRAFSQWRLDFPDFERTCELSTTTRQILAVAEKILTRGRITICSPFVEESLSRLLLGQPGIMDSVHISPDIFSMTPQREIDFSWFDSPSERAFYDRFLPLTLGPSFAKWVLPQVSLSSLLPRSLQSPVDGRADFLISHPSLPDPILIEIDGEQHEIHAGVDQLRDSILTRAGFRVIRIPACECETLSGKGLGELTRILQPACRNSSGGPNRDSALLFIYATKICHQIQLTLLQAIKMGCLNLLDPGAWSITADLDGIGLYSREEADQILRIAVADLVELLGKISNLYSVNINDGVPVCSISEPRGDRYNAIHIAYTRNQYRSVNTFYIQDIYVPFDIACESFPAEPARLSPPSEETLSYFLKYIFRKPYFWDGQYASIVRALEGKDTIVLLPTGSGKSLIFQLASLLLPGVSVVVEPIISLIQDQLDNLSSYGIHRCMGITSMISDAEERSDIIELFGQGEYLLTYVAPERFQMQEFRESLRALTVHTPVALVVIDEAHCVSEWGHDFRTSYLNIARIAREYCQSGGHIPPLVALTGTASRSVLKDVRRELQIQDIDAIITPDSFDRPELKFHILSAPSKEKMSKLKGYLGQMLPGLFGVSGSSFYQTRGHGTYSGLVFCPNVDGQYGVVEVAGRLRSELGINTSFYSGRQPKYSSADNWNRTKEATARDFKRNRIPLLVSTKAFGMGIDKANIRYTVHYCLPPSIEAFYQEAGRAGRDRRVAHCCIIVSDDDPERTKRLLDPNVDAEEVAAMVRDISWDENDDITRALFLHTNSFRGIDSEYRDILSVLEALSDFSHRSTRKVVFPSLNRNTAERSLHRLVILGVVSDYTIDYSSNEFTVYLSGADKSTIIDSYGAYVAGYSEGRRQTELEKAARLLDLPYKDFVLKMAELLLRFIYEVIEKGRRRALYEMLLAATVDPSDSGVRQRIVKYLGTTEYSERLDSMVEDPGGGIGQAKEIFESIVSLNDAAELRGQVSRYLESYPDHPGLLMLRALSEIMCRDASREISAQNFMASILSASENYSAKGQKLFDLISWGLEQLSRQDMELAIELESKILLRFNDPGLARFLVGNLPQTLGTEPAWFLLDRLTHLSQQLLINRGERKL